jgi:alkylation response protein AidB-like acyl-CoA dehydrogenase
LIRTHRDEAERTRQIPRPVFEAIARARLHQLYLPKSLGGQEVDPLTFVRVIEEVARADGSVAWALGIWATYGVFGGYLPEAAAREIYAAPDSVIAGTVNPTGTARAVPGGYRVSGRWGYGSGIAHASWVLGNCIVYDGDDRRLNRDGSPEQRIVFVPAPDCQIKDTWHVGGLRGTGSNDYSFADVFVPEERTCLAFVAPPTQSGPLYRCPFGTTFVASITAPALGIARGALDAFQELAGAKTPTGTTGLLRDRVPAQIDYARAEALLRSARAFLFETIEEVWETAVAGREVTAEQRALVRIACTHAAQSAAQAVDLVRNAGGATVLYESSPLERAFRDVHAATQHFGVSPLYFEIGGKVLLGLSPGTSRF